VPVSESSESDLPNLYYDDHIATRKNLKKADYIAAAFDFVDSNGIEVMTMRSLGAAMGVDPTAVYRHFPTKEELVNALVDQFLQTIFASLKTELTSPRERILDRAMCTRREFEKHPDVGVALVFGTGQSWTGLKMSQGIAFDLQELGVPSKSIPIAYQMLEGFVIGSCCQDFIRSPENYAIRRLRYRAIDAKPFDTVSKNDASVKKVADTAFSSGLNILLNHLETL
jgi:AcrR family transcriptional regulator